MTPFKAIRARAAGRKGGEAALAALLPKVANQKALAKLGDDRVLAEMSKRIFSAGFVWSVIEAKWPGFEAAFLEFAPRRLLAQPDEFWERLAGDKRIVRNPQKIVAVRTNARFVADIAEEHGGFGRFLAQWPAADQVGLTELLAKRGARLGGHTGQYFLRFIGKDGFVVSPDVRQFLMIGILGGFTTFSSFSLQTLALLREGEVGAAMGNVVLSVVLCLLAAWAGEELVRAARWS